MARYHERWARYVPVSERRRKAQRAVEALRKKGHSIMPVTIEGRAIATTFWGKAWCDNLESYRDYESRLPRGRTYVRNGSVVDLQIEPCGITAKVSGSSVYTVIVRIGAVPKLQWQSICKDCAGSIDSLVELLQGRFSKAVMQRICRQANGLFPKPSEIRFSCSCPDYASMCKHVAAVLYGVGARLDEMPELLFRLRDVNENDLVANIDQDMPITKKGPVVDKILETDAFSEIFGLDMAEAVEVLEPGGSIKAAGQPITRPGTPSAAPKASGQKEVAAVSKMAPGSGASSKRVCPKSAITRKAPHAIPKKDVYARDQKLRAIKSGQVTRRQSGTDAGMSANLAGKEAPARMRKKRGSARARAR